MIIKNLFEKEIDRPIQGVVTIGNEDEEQKWQELEEYVCTDEEGRHIIVYVNARTGQEENIYLLVEDENGILTI